MQDHPTFIRRHQGRTVTNHKHVKHGKIMRPPISIINHTQCNWYVYVQYIGWHRSKAVVCSTALIIVMSVFDDHVLMWRSTRENHYVACSCIELLPPSMKVMLTLRMGMAVLTTILIAFAIYYAPNQVHFWLYFSHWSLLLLLVMFLWGSAITLRVTQSEDDDVAWCYRVYGVLFRVACAANILSSIIYFCITFSYVDSVKRPVNHVIHTVNSLAALAEMFANAVPVRLIQVYQPVLFTVSYGIFLATFHFVTGEAVYKCLNWNDPKDMSRLCTGIMTLMFGIYFLMYIIYFCKIKCGLTKL
uniref:Maco-B 47 n=1 Tax=Mamestra configurata nucleopolyhedrovirus B TaxID=204440 RepID=A0A7G7Y8J9_9ABAC|nr:maco-B 47 [Mamestra configurata nucleopolyhedrovirus B]